MQARERLLQVATFVVVVGVVLAGTAAAAGYLTEGVDSYSSPPNVTNQQFQPENILPAENPETGSVEVTGEAESRTVLVDVGHENDVSEAEMNPLVSALVESGHEVRFFTREDRDLNESLRTADAYVVANPRQRYTDAQVAGVHEFAEAGGRVLVLADPAQTQVGGFLIPQVTQVGTKTTALNSRFGLGVGSGSLYNMQEYDLNYKNVYATPAGDDPVTEGVERVTFTDPAPVVAGEGASALLTGVEGTTLRNTRQTAEYPMLARNGNVTVVGDTDFLAPENVYVTDNEVLVGNLGDFLVTGDKTAGAPAPPEPEGPSGPTRPGGPTGPSGPSEPIRTPAGG